MPNKIDVNEIDIACIRTNWGIDCENSKFLWQGVEPAMIRVIKTLCDAYESLQKENEELRKESAVLVVDKMATQSLSPCRFEQWETIRNLLVQLHKLKFEKAESKEGGE